MTNTPRPSYVNLSLSRPTRHITGSRGIAPPILKFDIPWWCAVNFTPWPPDSNGTSCRHSLEVDGWGPGLVRTLQSTDKSLAPTRIRTPERPTRTVVTILRRVPVHHNPNNKCVANDKFRNNAPGSSGGRCSKRYERKHVAYTLIRETPPTQVVK